MKKQITIAQGALNYLHSVLDSTPSMNMADARKQSAAFRCMQDSLEKYRKDVEEIQKKWREQKIIIDPQNNEHKQWIIPDENKEAYENQLLETGMRMAIVQFDVESFTVIQRSMDGLFTRPDTAEKGISGETQMKFIEEIASAIENAQSV